jgi:hypothetical protein
MSMVRMSMARTIMARMRRGKAGNAVHVYTSKKVTRG